MELQNDFLYFTINPKNTNYVNRILEGYEYVGVMTTVNRQQGICVIRTTTDTRKIAKEILQSLPEVYEVFSDIESVRKFL